MIGYRAVLPVLRVTDFLFGAPAHLIMQRRQFQNLRRRLEAGTVEARQPHVGVDRTD